MGIVELLVILVIVLIIFGAGRLAELGEGLGRGIRNFRREFRSPDAIDVTPKPEPSEPPPVPPTGDAGHETPPEKDQA